MANNISLEASVEKRLRASGLRLDQLKKACEQIIVFGSMTIEGKRGSDLDLLCIGHGQRVKNPCVDLVWRCPDRIKKQGWLGSELANHVAHYGKWLHGLDNWSKSVFISHRAIRLKRRSIRSRARALERWWQKLRPEYKAKHVLKLRRDLQRLAMLVRRRAVEPSPLLDEHWRDQCRTYGDPAKALAYSVPSLLSRRQLCLIASMLE